MTTRYDYWKTFAGNPEESDPPPAWCGFCGNRFAAEDLFDGLCSVCRRAGAFRCDECGDYHPPRMRSENEAQICTTCEYLANNPESAQWYAGGPRIAQAQGAAGKVPLEEIERSCARQCEQGIYCPEDSDADRLLCSGR